jgi:cytidylate kinase
MLSIALFPCSYIDGARVVGELSNLLHLRVYTDELFFVDVSKQFDIPVKDLKKFVFAKTSKTNQFKLENKKYINLLKKSLSIQLSSSGRYLFYGLLTSLLGPENSNVLKVLVFDNEDGRVRRAMRQEGLSEKKARQMIEKHDYKVSRWTEFLYGKGAYDSSLYNIAINFGNQDLLDIISVIVQHYRKYESSMIVRPAMEVVKNIEIDAAAERVLSERAYEAGVNMSNGTG